MAKKKPRGFAYKKIHDPEGHKEVSRRGGEASQEKGRGYRWSKDEAREWAKIGGLTRAEKHRGRKKDSE